LRHRSAKPKKQLDIAGERIGILFEEAELEFSGHPERAHAHARAAKRIALKYNVRLPRELKQRFCKKCEKFLKKGVNAKVRLSGGCLTIICVSCGARQRYRFK